jgi:hypothetical protein
MDVTKGEIVGLTALAKASRTGKPEQKETEERQ